MGDVIVSVAAATIPVYEEEPDSQKADLLLQSIIKNTDVTSDILKQQIGNLPRKVNDMYNYVKDSEHIGLPYVWSSRGSKQTKPGTMVPTGIRYGSKLEIEEILESILLQQVMVRSVEIGMPIEEFVVKWYLQENQGYSITNNIVSAYPDPLDPQWEVSLQASNFRYVTDTYFEIRVTYLITDTTGVAPSYSEIKIFDIFDFDKNSTLYMVKYFLESDLSEERYWLYDVEDDTYPDIYVPDHRPSWEQGNEDRDFLPIIPLRKFKKSLSEDNEPEQYADAKHAAELMSIPYDELISSLEENPDIGNIYHAHVCFYVNINNNSDAVADYLWHHYKELLPVSTGSREPYERLWAFNSDRSHETRRSFHFWMADTPYYEHLTHKQLYALRTYDTSSGFAFVEERVHKGVVTKKKEYFLSDAYTASPFGVYAGQVNTSRTYRYLILRKQLTASTYSEIIVLDPFSLESVWTNQGGSDIYSLSYPDDGFYATAPNEHSLDDIRVPVNIKALNAMHSSIDKAQVIQSATSILIHGVDKQKLKWYQSGTFRGLLIVFAFILSAITLSPEIAAIATAGTLATAALLTLALVIDIYIFKVVVEYVVEFLVKELGLDDTFAAIVVLAAIAVTGAGLDLTGIVTLPSAQLLLQVTIAALPVFTELALDAINDLGVDSSEFLEEAQERQEEIDKANDLLSSNIDHLNLVSRITNNVNETPNEFFDRTIHTGNPGTLSLDFIENYVDTSLRLPETDTLYI
jgi:hypothetical protein